MAVAITMPKLGLTMTRGSVKEWKKKIGDTVKKGELLYTVATDKLTVDVESTADGVLLAVTISEGESVPVGAVIGYIGAEGEQVPAEAAAVSAPAPQAASAPAPLAPASPAAAASAVPVARGAGRRVPSSPKAKKLARELGVDLSRVEGTGPSGWVVARDVQAAAAAGTARTSPVAARMAKEAGLDLSAFAGARLMKEDVAGIAAALGREPAERRIPATQIRSVIAERMTLSVNTIPAVHYFADVDMTELTRLRQKFNGLLAKQGLKVSYNDIFIKLCARLLMENPMANASVEVEPDGSPVFVLHGTANVGLAVALSGGLIVPNVKDAQNKGVAEIARETQDLVQRARSGNLTLDEMTGGTFTVSSLGAIDIDSFTPIINPPEAAILGIGRIKDKPVVVEGEVVVRPMATLCLAVDHRLLDGADAAQMLARLKELVESPETFLL
ncbi:MAG: 2-oxo acid dehydrogenase subunit E2 [Fretibacterium sp.]|nr:2-oxo acid dehydrogenase subunit E2 [Fretibacterium sp.]